MESKKGSEYRELNQDNYSKKATDHGALGLNSTMYLAYRDINDLLKRHLYPNIQNNKIRFLDFGCGAGTSTDIVSTILQKNTECDLEITGVDINEANLKVAKEKVPDGKFECIQKGEKLNGLGEFDLII